jgi:phage FluMu protein Com
VTQREEATTKAGRDCRCDCGQLLAKATEAGVEIKCKRCRRVFTIPWSRLAGETA